MDKILKDLPEGDQQAIVRVRELFQIVDSEVARFVELTGIRCPQGCGRCCDSLKIETTALEMLPLAAHLWANGEAENTLVMLKRAALTQTEEAPPAERTYSQRPKTARCIFYEQNPGISQNGRCNAYDLRPLICRLFGFFSVKDKHGKYVYGSCKVIKERYPNAFLKAQEAIQNGFHPSAMTDFSIQIISMATELGKEMLPINTAAQIAIEKIGLALHLKNGPPKSPDKRAA